MKEGLLKLQGVMGNLQSTTSKRVFQRIEKLKNCENSQSIGSNCLLLIVNCQLITD